ncbi:hypothetical protein HDV05_005411 [Chytridiales sp. JEL 0842]|nr:hypothetical protein HDV05_005411 [Chytridiales sp. JEL 0842]
MAGASRQPDYATVPTADRDEEDVPEVDHLHGASGDVTGTIFGSWLNITNTILGSGMLAMPSALAAVGLGLGSVMIIVSGLASSFGLTLLTICASRVGRHSSFNAVSNITYPTAAIYFDMAIAIKCFGVSISYLVIIGDLMPKVVRGFFPTIVDTSFFLDKNYWITVSIMAVIPFAFARKLDSLRHTSALALCAVVYLVLIVVSYFIFPVPSMPPRPTWAELNWIKLDSRFFTTLPIFVFAFTCHQNIFSIYNELIDNTFKRIGKVIRLSIGTALIIYQVVGILGYLSFGNTVKSNIIQMYPSSLLITGGQLALAILFLLSYPLQCHPARASLDKVISKGSTAPMSNTKFTVVTVCLLAFSYILSIAVKDLSTVLSLVGATGSTTIGYILPGLLYYRLRQNTDSADAPKWDRMKVASLALAGFGFLVMIISVSVQVSDLFTGAGGGGTPHVHKRDLMGVYMG